MNRLGLKLGCLIISLVIWIQVASNHEIEQTLALPLQLDNLADGYTRAGNEMPAVVDVRLRGSKLRLLAHLYFNKQAGSVVVDLGGEEPGPMLQREITINDVRSDLDVLAVVPAVRLRLRIDEEVNRFVPVSVVTTGRLPEGYQLLIPPAATPDSVALVGPSRFFGGNERVETEPVTLEHLRESTTRVERLVSPHEYLTPMVDKVAVHILVAAVEARTFANIPVVALVDADQPEVTVFPPVADLVLSGPADSIRAVVPARIAVTLSLSGLSEGIHHLRGQVDLPTCLSFVSIEPETFMAIIGEVNQAVEESDQP